MAPILTMTYLKEVTENDAAEIVEFVREYLAHVYIMPMKLEATKKRKSKSGTVNPPA